MANYLRLLKFIKGHWNLFFISVFIMFVAGFFEIFSFSLMAPITDIVFTQKKVVVPNELPQFVANYIDYLNNAEPRWLMPRIFGAFFFLMVFKNFLIFGYQYLMGDMTQRVMRDVRYRLYERIQTLSLDYFSEKRTGELLSRITHDSNLLENAVSYGLTDLFRQTFIIIFWIITAFTIDPKAALIIFGIFPFIGLPMSLIGKRLRKISIGIQETMADINSLLLETISGVKLVKAFNTEQYEIQRFKGQNHGYYKLKLKAMKSLILISPLTEVIGAVVSIILVFWFGDRILDGELSFGVFALFMASIMSIISPVKKLGNVNALIQQALAANDRIYDVLDTKPSVEESPTAKEAAELKDNIRLENVEFHYREDSGVVLHDINLEIKKGDLVAIVGPTGTGKSTLVNLLPRFYDATKGKVLFDGMNVRDLSFQS
ncbi:MAG: ABC transporter ATP-binding protein, partial [Candidatus Omnitrophica bacterium]|nr:ABC transporter ATP-binding protein [Candidatus Omnitrophota bacterium]